MKKLKVLLLAAVMAVPFLQSCNSKIDQPSLIAIVTIVETIAQPGFYAVTDANEKIFVGTTNRFGSYKVKDGQRAAMYFTPLETKVEGFKYNADVYSITNLPTSKIKVLTTENEKEFGADKIALTQGSITGKFLNLSLVFLANGSYEHKFEVVDNTVDIIVPGEEYDGYIVLDFKHDGNKVEYGQKTSTVACFEMPDEYNPKMLGKKGFCIRYKPLESDEAVKYITVDLPKEI